MDVDAPLGFGVHRDPNPPPPPSPGSANPNPLEPVALIGLGASLPPLSPKQGGKVPSIVCSTSLSWLVLISRILGLNASIVKININVMERKMVLRACCNT